MLQWSPDIEWAVVPDAASCSVGSAADTVCVAFSRAGAPMLDMRLGRHTAAALAQWPEQAVGTSPLAALLHERRALTVTGDAIARVSLFATSSATPAQTMVLPAPRPVDVHVLAGDEAQLLAHAAQFIAECSPHTLVATLRLTPEGIVLTPLRFPHEAVLPVQRGVWPRTYPAWERRLPLAWDHVRELMVRALAGPEWIMVTTRGARLAWQWEACQHAYRLDTTPVTPPPGCLELYHAQAGVEGRFNASGSASTPQRAAFIATCEAWERFCLERADLAVPASTTRQLDSVSGPAFEYMRALTQPLGVGPSHVSGCVGGDDGDGEIAVPTEWVYLAGDPSVTNTNGVAFGATHADAAASAWQELQERDALLRCHMGLAAAQPIAIDEALACGSIALPGRRLQWLRLNADNTNTDMDVILCLLTAPRPPFVCVGVAARGDRIAAARKAFYEAAAAEVVWAREIELGGSRAFVARAQHIMTAPPQRIGLKEGAWAWAGRVDGAEALVAHLCTAPLAAVRWTVPQWDTRVVTVDVGRGVIEHGHVLRVLHPDALPLPSCHHHLVTLCEQLGLPTPPPLPLT